jgi:hypothetical protein
MLKKAMAASRRDRRRPAARATHEASPVIFPQARSGLANFPRKIPLPIAAMSGPTAAPGRRNLGQVGSIEVDDPVLAGGHVGPVPSASAGSQRRQFHVDLTGCWTRLILKFDYAAAAAACRV